MRIILKHKGRDITWVRALLLTVFWFLMVSVFEAILMTVLFGSHALFRIYLMGDRGVDALPYLLIGAWIVVIGHVMAMIVGGLLHKSWKIVLLYVGIPAGIGVLLALWISAVVGNMMAA